MDLVLKHYPNTDILVVELGKWLCVSASWLGVLGVVGGKV